MNPPNFDRVMVFKEPDLNKAAVEGYSARRGGRAMTDNPYPVASFRGSVWEDAWIIADSELPKVVQPSASVYYIAKPGALRLAPGAIEHHVAPRTKRDRLITLALAVGASIGLFALAGAMGVPKVAAIVVCLAVAAAGAWRATK